MPEISKQKILAGRKAVDAYRTAHTKLYEKGWHRGVPEEHTPLLRALVNALEGLGFTSAHTDFEPRKDEILAKFFAANDDLNAQELGYKDLAELESKTAPADRQALYSLEGMWH